MITRIVKLTIHPEKTQEFKIFFYKNKQAIESFEGCFKVQLLKDVKYPNIYFTYSHWKDENLLNEYRNSEIFSKIWKHAKSCFCDKPIAWSLTEV